MSMIAPRLPAGWIRARRYHLLAPLFMLALVAVFAHSWVVEFIEDQTVNLRFRIRAPFDPPADPRIIFVGIDQASLDLYGRYPWPRTVIADFLTNLAKAQDSPHTVAFDILYTEKSINPADDVAMGNAAGLLPSVITGALCLDRAIPSEEERTITDLKKPGQTTPFTQINGDARKIRGSNTAVFPVAPLREQSFFAFVNDEPSPIDYIRHTIPLVIRIGDQVYPSLALQTLCQALHVDADKVVVNVGKNVFLKNASGKSWTIPMNDRGEFTINYRSNSSFNPNCLSFGKFTVALKDCTENGAQLPKECDVRQKTLLIGETETGLTDLGPTPVEAQSPLPYTHLNVINNVLKNDYLTFVPQWYVVIGWIFLTWSTLLRVKSAPLIEAVLLPIMMMFLYVVFAFAIFWSWSVQIALAWPVLSYAVVNFGGVILRWREEQKGREQIKQVFSRMLSSEVMDHLLEHPENIKMGGTERAATILFSDIRDYTKFSEGLGSEEVMRQLNVYFERMVPCIQECEGTMHKYIGDAIMAAWGDIAATSNGVEQDTRNSVHSALMMRRRLHELNEERRVDGLMPMRIGIGLNHGIVNAGLLGAASRSEFTVIGDAVNVASRIEGVTKEFHTDLAISDSVQVLLGDEFLVRRLGFIQLKGKTTPTLVYEVLAEKDRLGDSKMTPDIVLKYEQAFDDFLARRFTEAEKGFRACEEKYPNDYCVQNYLKASRDFSTQPPPPEWDGRIVMTTK